MGELPASAGAGSQGAKRQLVLLVRVCTHSGPQRRAGSAASGEGDSGAGTAGKGFPGERAAWEEVRKEEGAGRRGQTVIPGVHVPASGRAEAGGD